MQFQFKFQKRQIRWTEVTGDAYNPQYKCQYRRHLDGERGSWATVGRWGLPACGIFCSRPKVSLVRLSGSHPSHPDPIVNKKCGAWSQRGFYFFSFVIQVEIKSLKSRGQWLSHINSSQPAYVYVSMPLSFSDTRSQAFQAGYLIVRTLSVYHTISGWWGSKDQTQGFRYTR